MRGPLPADFTYQARRRALAELAGWCAGVRKRRLSDGAVEITLDTARRRGGLTRSRLAALRASNPAAARALGRVMAAQLGGLVAAALNRPRRSAGRDARAHLAYVRALSGWRQSARRPLLCRKRTPRQRARRAARRGACRAGPGGDPDPDDPSCGGRRRWGCRGGRWPQRACPSRPAVCGEFIRASFEPGLTPGLRPHVEVWAPVGRAPGLRGRANERVGGDRCAP